MGEEVELQAPLQRLDVTFDGVGFMSRVPIDHKKILPVWVSMKFRKKATNDSALSLPL